MRSSFRARGHRGLCSLLLALACFVAAGCGEMTQGELDRRIGTLESIAAEGSILARQVAEERTKTTFARVRARELADDVDHESEKIADATPEADQVGRRDRTVELADRVGAALGELQTFPDEPGRAAGIESDLERLAGRLSDLLARK